MKTFGTVPRRSSLLPLFFCFGSASLALTMAASQHEEQKGDGVSDMSLPPASSVALKDGVEETITAQTEDRKPPPVSYPQSWRLWLIYIATLFTMFLVPLDMVRLELAPSDVCQTLISADHCCNSDPQDYPRLSEPR